MAFSVPEFERFVRKVQRELSQLPYLAVQKLASAILGRVGNDPRLFGSQIRGPAGQTVSYMTGAAAELGQATARAVLSFTPGVKFIDIYPRFKSVLRFEWPDAPPGAIGESQRQYPPVVFYKHVRVPVRVSIDTEEFREAALREWDSAEFKEWVADQIAAGMIGGGQFSA